ncbi:MAG: IS66 family insertion sequence element accessory protein TnpB [Bryobacteraceae bacterium]
MHRQRRGPGDAAQRAGCAAVMIHLPASVRVYLCLSPCDMRRSFDGLHALVRDHLQLDAFAGQLYLFANKRRDRLKILYWGVSRMQVQTCNAVPKMGDGLPESAFRSWLQTVVRKKFETILNGRFANCSRTQPQSLSEYYVWPGA